MAQRSEVKIVFLGDTTVGKTSIITSHSRGSFSTEEAPTVGVCFSTQVIDVGGAEVKAKVWDTAGQERFRSLTPFYFRDADVVVLVFAVDSKNSFEGAKCWYESVRREAKTRPQLVIAANKTDLSAERRVPTEEGECFADTIGAAYIECSAKSGMGIEELFAEAVSAALRVREVRSGETQTLSSGGAPRGCCGG